MLRAYGNDPARLQVEQRRRVAEFKRFVAVVRRANDLADMAERKRAGGGVGKPGSFDRGHPHPQSLPGLPPGQRALGAGNAESAGRES